MRACRFGTAALALVMIAPAKAEVHKIMFQYADKQQFCRFLRPSVAIPDGWVEDKAASRHFRAVILVPQGVAFNDAEAVIYVVAK
jgi:hypothetical protein